MPHVAADELDEGILGGSVEPGDLEGRQPQPTGGRDAVLPVDDRSVLTAHHDRRPGAVELGEGFDVPGVEPLDPQ